MLDGRISNIQTSWVKLGATGTQMMLHAIAADIGTRTSTHHGLRHLQAELAAATLPGTQRRPSYGAGSAYSGCH